MRRWRQGALPTVPFLFVVLACGDQEAPDPTQLVTQLLSNSAAWNWGDLYTFVEHYASEPTTTFVSEGHVLHGSEWILRNYEPAFALEATRDWLRFEEVEARAIGEDYILATARFELSREDSVTSSRPFTLILRRTGKRWKIIHDHTSRD